MVDFEISPHASGRSLSCTAHQRVSYLYSFLQPPVQSLMGTAVGASSWFLIRGLQLVLNGPQNRFTKTPFAPSSVRFRSQCLP